MNHEIRNLTRALRDRLLPQREEDLMGPFGRRRYPKYFQREDVDDIEHFMVALMGEDFQANPGTTMYGHIQGRGYPTMVRRSAYYIARFRMATPLRQGSLQLSAPPVPRELEEDYWQQIVVALQASLARRPFGFCKREAARALLPIARRLSHHLYFSTGKRRRERRSLLREATDDAFEEEVLPALETFLNDLEPELPHVLEHLYKHLLEVESEFYEEMERYREEAEFQFVRSMRS